MTLSVVISVFNEVRTAVEVIARVLKAPVCLAKEIIVVDDASTDGTRQPLKNMLSSEVHVIFHAVNRGKGAAIRTGVAHAGGDIVLI